MDKEKFVKDYLKPLIVAALENVVDVRYTFTGSYENGEEVREENVNVSHDSLLQMTEDVVGRLLK